MNSILVSIPSPVLEKKDVSPNLSSNSTDLPTSVEDAEIPQSCEEGEGGLRGYLAAIGG